MMQSCTFAAFADPHYAQRDPHIGRFYRQSPEKLRQCLPAFSAPDVDFVVCLGDLVDGTRADAEEMAALAKEAGKPVCYAAGNHDLAALPRETLQSIFDWPDPNGYYAFTVNGIRFLVLDTNHDGDSDRLPPWDVTSIDARQLAWLRAQLADPKPTVVFAHANLDDRRRPDGTRDPHVIVNHAEVRSILEASGQVHLVVQGHCHAGACTHQNGIEYLTLRAMVQGLSENDAAIITVRSDGTHTIRRLFGEA